MKKLTRIVVLGLLSISPAVLADEINPSDKERLDVAAMSDDEKPNDKQQCFRE